EAVPTPARVIRPVPIATDAGDSADERDAAAAGDVPGGAVGGWSPDELLHQRDFGELTGDELARVRTLVAALATARPTRCTPRCPGAVRRHARGTTLDMRLLARASLATGGDPLERTFSRRREVPRRLVALCDVSGSMEPYSRMLLLFVHALLRSGRGVDAFAF